MITDDPALIRSLDPRLQQLGLNPGWVTTYRDALDQMPGDWQAVLLDLLVPRTERYTICREARAAFGLPVILVDERPEDASAASLGADFYLGKPITAESICASLHAIQARRLNGLRGPLSEIVIFSDAKVAFVDGHQLDLTFQEFILLVSLAGVEGEVVSPTELALSLKAASEAVEAASVDVHIARLMAKLATRSSRRVVRSSRNDGDVLL